MEIIRNSSSSSTSNIRTTHSAAESTQRQTGDEGVKIVANGNEVKKEGQQAIANGWDGRSGPVVIASSNNKTDELGQNAVANAKEPSMQNNGEAIPRG